LVRLTTRILLATTALTRPPLVPLNAEVADEYDDASTTTSESHGEDDAWTSRQPREPPQSAQPQDVVTEDLGEPLPELSDHLDQSRLDEEEDTQAAVEEARYSKLRR
jgi:hypothetical protein